jgi:serine/threonine protein kinase
LDIQASDAWEISKGVPIFYYLAFALQAPRTKYIWLHELGRGRFGATYLVQDKATGEHFAIKQISKTQPSYTRSRIVTEVKAHAAVCDHPNVAGDAHTFWITHFVLLYNNLFELSRGDSLLFPARCNCFELLYLF